MYRYETHLHTFPVSRCAKASVEESLRFYKSIGYDGVFVTNHFVDGNINIDKALPYEEQINFYFSDYEKALELSEEIGIKVFLGIELSYKGTDFLVYGLDKKWFLSHPEITTMKKSDELKFMIENGALIFQAHPFRNGGYIDHIRLYPHCVHGVEIINAARPLPENDIAKLYCKHYNLIEFAGSDNHTASKRSSLAGVCTKEPVLSVEDFIEKVKNKETEIFHIKEDEINKLCEANL